MPRVKRTLPIAPARAYAASSERLGPSPLISAFLERLRLSEHLERFVLGEAVADAYPEDQQRLIQRHARPDGSCRLLRQAAES